MLNSFNELSSVKDFSAQCVQSDFLMIISLDCQGKSPVFPKWLLGYQAGGKKGNRGTYLNNESWETTQLCYHNDYWQYNKCSNRWDKQGSGLPQLKMEKSLAKNGQKWSERPYFILRRHSEVKWLNLAQPWTDLYNWSILTLSAENSNSIPKADM